MLGELRGGDDSDGGTRIFPLFVRVFLFVEGTVDACKLEVDAICPAGGTIEALGYGSRGETTIVGEVGILDAETAFSFAGPSKGLGRIGPSRRFFRL